MPAVAGSADEQSHMRRWTNERALALLGHDQTLALQESDGPPNSRTARPVLRCQHVLGRQTLARLTARRQDLGAEILSDALVRKRLALYFDHHLILQVVS